MSKHLKFLFTLVLIVTFFSGCGRGKHLKQYTETRQIFSTYVSVNCYYDEKVTDIFTVIAKCWERMEVIHTEMNARSNVGYVARVNESGFYGVEVSESLHGLLGESLKYSKITEGAFDVTVYPLVELWREAAKNQKVPDKKTLAAVKDKVGYQYLVLEDANVVHLKKKGMKIDVGAIAKGYAVDQFAEILKLNKVDDFIIDAGGDIYCNGKDNGKNEWLVGVQDPINTDKIAGKLKLSNRAVTTSGDYERFSVIEGKRYSHIIDPITGFPEDIVISATVIAPSAEESDAYSTAFSVMGGDKGIKLANKLENVEAMIIEKIGKKIKRYQSNGYKEYKG
ncbi:MAG: FAD:protein FMN transferase [Candidatus Omnitrophica bacterium]|nr:FAD:protein FMN transferase [Candidatus Omnitrophota bacterium]